jgi:catechol 2,3-dioxygenase
MTTNTQKNEHSGGYFRPRRLGHVNLYVADMDKTMSFYTKVLGIQEAYRTPLGGGGFVSNGNTHHDLGFTDAYGALGKPRGAQPGQLSHIAFELESETELVASYRKATADGVKFLRTADHDIAHSAYGQDPEGVVYELYADVVKDWRRQRHGIVTKPKPDWYPGLTPPVDEVCYHDKPEITRVTDAVFHPKRTTHASIVVDDLEQAIDHYLKIVGLSLDPASRGKPFAILKGSCGERSLVLHRSHPNRGAGYHHVSLEVASPAELDASVKRAKSSGLHIRSDVSHLGRRAVTLNDPDDTLVCFYADEAGEPPAAEVDVDLALFIL